MALDDMNEGILQVSNHKDHPSNKAYKVFFFRSSEEANYFETLLQNEKIKFEKDSEETEKGELFLFGIRKSDLRIVGKLNLLTIGKYRKPLFPHPTVKYVVILFILIITTLIIISYNYHTK